MMRTKLIEKNLQHRLQEIESPEFWDRMYGADLKKRWRVYFRKQRKIHANYRTDNRRPAKTNE